MVDERFDELLHTLCADYRVHNNLNLEARTNSNIKRGLRNDDGTKAKKKVVDSKTGVKFEKYGHLSDCLDYLLCYYLRDNWYRFKNGEDSDVGILSTAVLHEGFCY